MTLLLDITLKATILLGLAGAVSVLLVRHPPALRHFVWTLAVTGVLLLPVLSTAFPHLTVQVASGVPGWIVADAQQLHDPPTLRPAIPSLEMGTGVAEVIESRRVPAVPLERGVATKPRAETAQAASVGAGAATDAGTDVVGTTRPWLALLWAGGAVVLLAGLAGALAQLRIMARESEPVFDPAVQQAAAGAARQLGVSRPVRILSTPRRAMPMTWGLVYPVVMLPSDAGSWPPSRLDAVLMHEMAHVRRLDYLTQFLARIVCALLWFHPLAWYAARRLRVERELACDDLVVRTGSRPSEYAGHLLELARDCRAGGLASQASLPLARQSHLGRRLAAVLDAHRSRDGVSVPAALVGVGVALTILVPLAAATPVRRAADVSIPWPVVAGAGAATHSATPTAAIAPQPHRARPPTQPQRSQRLLCDWTRGDNSSSSTSIDDDRVRIRLEVDRCRLELEATGQITFADDYTDVTGIGASGWFTLEERTGGSRRELEIEPSGTGLARRWRVDGDERPFDDDARQWLAEALLVVFRRTAFRAEERGTRILERSGVQGLLDEIELMTSGHAISRYYAVLFTHEQLDAQTVERIVTQAARRIESDHALGRVLLAIAESQPLDASAQAAYMAAAHTIESDHERRRVLSAILRRPDLDPNVAEAMLEAAAGIESDHELGGLLRELIAAYPLERTMTPAFFAAVRSIESDHERGQVLSALLERGEPSMEALDATLSLTEEMDSDHEMAQLLLLVIERYPPDRTLPASFVAAARRIDSDRDQGRVWSAVLQWPTVSREAIATALEAAATSIESDHERTQLLLTVAQQHTIDDAVRPAYFAAVDRTSSDHSRGQVLEAVIDAQSSSRATALAVLDAAGAISSDHTLSQVLLHFAAVVDLDEEMQSAYRRAASGISSDRTRERVLARVGST